MPRTWVGWLILIIIVWFVISMPAVAGADLGRLGHGIDHAFHQFSVFVSSI